MLRKAAAVRLDAQNWFMETPRLERKSNRERSREKQAIMTVACSYSRRMRHLSSLESMIYFPASRKGYVCHRAPK